MKYRNKILQGHTLEILPKLPVNCADMVITSPPYWGLRDYDTEGVIWDGQPDCEHEWSKFKREGQSGGVSKKLQIKGKDNFQRFDDIQQSFCQKCGAWKGELGLEPTVDLYIQHLCGILEACRRPLKREGTLWINLGDTYGGSGKGIGGENPAKESWNFEKDQQSTIREMSGSIPAKSLAGIPFHFALEMMKRGWILRNTLIWHKPNVLPSSAKDRFTIDFEYLFLFSQSNNPLYWTNCPQQLLVESKPLGIRGYEYYDWKFINCPQCGGIGEILNEDIPIIYYSPCKQCKGLGKIKENLWAKHDYYFEQQFEPFHPKSDDWYRRELRGRKKYNTKKPYKDNTPYMTAKAQNPQESKARILESMRTSKGRTKRCVWSINTRSFLGAHFAVFPEELLVIPIKAGCPEFACQQCGKGRVAILEPSEEYQKILDKNLPTWKSGNLKEGHRKLKIDRCTADYQKTGYADCDCGVDFNPGIVLDPFIGSGTTGIVAKKLGRDFVGIELKEDYCQMANKRLEPYILQQQLGRFL